MRHPIDPDHWLHRLSPDDWVRTALAEAARAESSFQTGDRKAALALCRRAAGMALNGALATYETYPERYGRSYLDHVMALRTEETAPAVVRDAAGMILETPLPGAPVVALRTAGGDERVLEATRTVMAHAYAIVIKADES